MNKQEQNIKDIITLHETEDIVDTFLDVLCELGETVALISNKELVEYALEKVLQEAWTSVKKVDFELENIEYMISVDNNGNLVVQPVEYYDDKYFSDIRYAFVSMEGDVQQVTIDYLLNRDIPIILFGCEDEYEENYAVNGEWVSKGEFDDYIAKFKSTYTVNNHKVDKDAYAKELDKLENRFNTIIQECVTDCRDFIDEIYEFRKLFSW